MSRRATLTMNTSRLLMKAAAHSTSNRAPGRADGDRSGSGTTRIGTSVRKSDPLGRRYPTGMGLKSEPTSGGGPRACPIADALELIGERWSLLVLREVMLGVHR